MLACKILLQKWELMMYPSDVRKLQYCTSQTHKDDLQVVEWYY